ncbi:hypothetical protein [Candidatus Methylomirabilis sp.]|uniref:hypothetical protein n=1 Tax=Candidatus Methylomirabilis sp. TaxID=2032687 RepID=UPI003C74655A
MITAEELLDDGEAAKAHLAAGRAIYYSDNEYPGQIVREWPDGSRQLVQIDRFNAVTVVLEICA